MRDQLERRLGELRTEYEAGRKVLADLEAKQADVQETLLRISGAVQVLEELLEPPDGAAAPDVPVLAATVPPAVPEAPDRDGAAGVG